MQVLDTIINFLKNIFSQIFDIFVKILKAVANFLITNSTIIMIIISIISLIFLIFIILKEIKFLSVNKTIIEKKVFYGSVDYNDIDLSEFEDNGIKKVDTADEVIYDDFE